ncbi:MAG: DUF6672 family protein [Sphaerochaetaceae bacterium]
MNRIILSRRNLFQLAALLVVILLAVVMFIIGRQHTILLDNKTIEHGGKTYTAFPIVEVVVDTGEAIELAARDRDKAEVVGQHHKISVTYTDKFFEEHKIVKKLKVPIGFDMVLVSIPALVGELDESVLMQHYIPPTAAVAPQAEVIPVVDDLGVDLGTF